MIAAARIRRRGGGVGTSTRGTATAATSATARMPLPVAKCSESSTWRESRTGVVWAEFPLPRPLEHHVAVGVLAAEEPGASPVWCHGVLGPFALLGRFFHAGWATRPRVCGSLLSVEELTAADADCPGTGWRLRDRMPGCEKKPAPGGIGDEGWHRAR